MLEMKLEENLKDGFYGFCLGWQRIGEEEIDNESRFEHMELEYLEGIWEELFSR